MGLDFLFDGIISVTWKKIVMLHWYFLIYLAIVKQLEPTLLLLIYQLIY